MDFGKKKKNDIQMLLGRTVFGDVKNEMCQAINKYMDFVKMEMNTQLYNNKIS